MYVLMASIGIIGIPYALLSRKNTYNVIRLYCHSVFFVLKYVAGIKVEFRGKIPTEPCLICSKHQSFLDVMMLASVLPNYRFIMKSQLTYLPVVGFYARQTGTVAVNRAKKVGTVNRMITSLNEEVDRQTIVYPQGTRVLPNEQRPYKVGAGLIYSNLKLKCYLVATNTGMFWARRSLYRYSGTAVIEFIDVLDEGLEVDQFMAITEQKIEEASTRLMDEVRLR
jgi:1-acyl-sn-glycerol-3-phosphate acyltransferase